MSPGEAQIVGQSLTTVDTAGAVRLLSEVIHKRVGGYVVTANADHFVLLQKNDLFRRAYDGALFRLVDGAPVAFAASVLTGRRVPRAPGADVAPALCAAAAEHGWRVVVAGGAPGVATMAARKIRERFPDGAVIPLEVPFLDDEGEAPDASELAARIRAIRPDMVLLGLGAPKQEIWCLKHASQVPGTLFLCCGAAVDFLAESVDRAPRWMRSSGLEWLYRLIKEPRRLWKRYLLRDVKFVWLALQHLAGRSSTR